MAYAYDSLYRLQGSTGGLNGRKNYGYWLDMAYDANGRILRKSQLTRVFTSTSSDTLMNYAHLYNYGTAPVNNRVQSVADTVGTGPAQTFTWDANGNMLSHASSIGVRTHCWDELNRLQGSADKKHNACYLYDAGGDRFYKFSGTPDIMYVNGQWHTYLTFSDPTLYASPYLVATNKGYTKHYYAESERVASKIGGGGLQNLHAVCDELYNDNTSTTSTHIRPRPYAELPALDFEAKRDSSKMHLKRLADCVEGEMGEIKENILVVLNQYAAGDQASPHSEDECYWYHPDHLGSASWVSDKAGKGIQHLYYLPWGEELDNQRATDYASRYTFSGKERDMETGYGYFGARYYNSDLSIWLSVDPLADKYPGVSPYVYCANNPVRLVDPDGREIYFLFYTDNESCFKASAETRKYNIEHSNHFNKNKDIVFLVAISDLADIESIVSYTVNQFSEKYGQTVELGIWSHAGYDGPCGTTTTSGNYSIYNQMTIEGWSQINFNWSDMDATATFYGCNTGAKNGEKESFAQKISELDNFHNVQVRGQQTAAYPSTNPCWRDINFYHAKLGWFSSRNTYMVGGRNGKGFAAVFGGDYAIPLSCFKNGRRQLPTYQQSK